MQIYFDKIAKQLNIGIKQVSATVALLTEGASIPFIARYRKEVTGNLDEVLLTDIRDKFQQLVELDKRRTTIIATLKELNKLTPELDTKIRMAETLTVLEDIYLPYKPKRKTKASVAKEKGLEPLAESIFLQENIHLETLAASYLNEELGVTTTKEALAGASDIIAEWVAEDAEVRNKMRRLFMTQAILTTKVISDKEEAGQKYKDYFDYSEKLKEIPSHRLLAIRRAEKELVLRVNIAPDYSTAVELLVKQIIKKNNDTTELLKNALTDSYKRLLAPSMDTELRLWSKQKADEEAIKVFAENVRQLLLAAPMGQKRIIAIDPGFRTGCKLVVLDEQGKLLENANIYPHNGKAGQDEAKKLLERLVKQYATQAIGIGNGTAGRETEQFVKSIGLKDILVVMINESGASIYSASEVARNEFPDKDITVRGAISIGRRLLDPLAELVKIDPKSIGVGQYQHDVDQNKLQLSLDDTVISCVNAVGVELNTASEQLLSYVSGLGTQQAKNIVAYRNQNGAFRTRLELKKVPKLGEKAFEQAAGFLRIHNAEHPLDASAVHPERYALVALMAKDLGCTVNDLVHKEDYRKNIDIKKYVSLDVGLPTLEDIMNELAKPGRDPRQQFEVFEFAQGINDILDLRLGMKLPGIVTNITKFGVFVDIGVHQDGLIHLSQLANRYISNPNEVVRVQQKVMVTVLDVDIDRKRISLSMKEEEARTVPSPMKTIPIQKQKKINLKEGNLQDQLLALQEKFKN